MSAVHRLEYAASTQDVLHALAAEGAPAGTAVMADEQGAGRGSRGRHWHSPRGGLWLSVLLRPARPIGLEVLSLRVGLAVAGALAHLDDLPPIELKWPNDLMAAGRKLGGILCEARWQGDALGWIAVGVGLNVANPLPADVAATATRLADYRPDLSPDALVGLLAGTIATLDRAYALLDEDELAAFAGRDWLWGKALAAPIVGYGAGVTRDGALRVRAADGLTQEVRSGTPVVADGPF